MKNSNRVSVVFTVDKKLRITSWNNKLEKICGKAVSEIKGVPYYEIMPIINKSGTDAVKLVLRNGNPLTLKGHMFLCVYGRNKSDIRITPLKDKKGNVSSAKITTKVVHNCNMMNRLEQSQRLIDIGRVAATLAHGVRNPLNTIKGSVIYIREKYANEKRLIEFTKIMEEEISRLDKFIANFLSTSFTDEDLYKTDINIILKKIEVLTSLTVQSHKIKSVFEYGDIAPVMINPFHLEHAVLNVINNAIEAMSSGGQLVVRSKPETHSNKEFAIVEVSDTGCGVSEGKYDNMITSSKTKGKGLGLFITREILRSCGGHLEFKSVRGSGTTVKLYLPVQKNE